MRRLPFRWKLRITELVRLSVILVLPIIWIMAPLVSACFRQKTIGGLVFFLYLVLLLVSVPSAFSLWEKYVVWKLKFLCDNPGTGCEKCCHYRKQGIYHIVSRTGWRQFRGWHYYCGIKEEFCCIPPENAETEPK